VVGYYFQFSDIVLTGSCLTGSEIRGRVSKIPALYMDILDHVERPKYSEVSQSYDEHTRVQRFASHSMRVYRPKAKVAFCQ